MGLIDIIRTKINEYKINNLIQERKRLNINKDNLTTSLSNYHSSEYTININNTINGINNKIDEINNEIKLLQRENFDNDCNNSIFTALHLVLFIIALFLSFRAVRILNADF